MVLKAVISGFIIMILLVIPFLRSVTPSSAYYYSVAAQFMGNEGYSTETNKVVVGSAYEVPFEEQFNDGALDYWTVLDQNQDYSTWWQTSGYVYSQAGWKNGSDDWLISPAIHLKPGRYRFSLSATPPPVPSI